jgi:hypothetical protein
MTTKRTHSKGRSMRSEYRLDYSKAKPNRFAPRSGEHVVAVVLDSDVASVFQTSESVNTLLRSVISAIPSQSKPASQRRRLTGREDG